MPIVGLPLAGLAVPTITVEIAFANNALDALAGLTWTDVSTYCLGFSTKMGRQHELNRVEASTADIILDNKDRRFDPTYTAGPYGANVLPMKRVRIRAAWGSITYPVFCGFIESWPPSWPDETDSYVTIHCVDALGKVLALQNLLNPYVQAIQNDNPIAHYLTSGVPGSGPVHGTGNLSTLVPLTAANMGFSPGAGAFAGNPTFNQIDPINDGVNGGVLFTGATGDELMAPLAASRVGNLDFSLECWWMSGDAATAHLARQLPLWPGGFQCYVSGGQLIFNTPPYSITTAGTYADQKWHHLVSARAGNVLTIYVDGAQVLTVNVGGLTLMEGAPIHIGPGPDNPTEVHTMYELAGYDQALSATQVLAHYNAASAWANDLSGARVNRILDAVGWPSADRSVEAGLSLLQAEPQPRNVLTSITNAALAENGLLFQAPDGTIQFFDRSHLVLNAASNTSQVTFGDGGGSERPYILAGIAPVMDDLDLWNDVQVTAAGGVMQRAQDAPSQTSYGTRSLALTSLVLASDNDSLSRAQHDLGTYKAPLTRVRNFTVTPHSDPTNLFPQALGRLLWDRVTFKRTPPGGGARFSQDSIIEGIAHKYSKAAGWETTFASSPADPASYFVLGTSTLDGSDVLFY